MLGWRSDAQIATSFSSFRKSVVPAMRSFFATTSSPLRRDSHSTACPKAPCPSTRRSTKSLASWSSTVANRLSVVRNVIGGSAAPPLFAESGEAGERGAAAGDVAAEGGEMSRWRAPAATGGSAAALAAAGDGAAPDSGRRLHAAGLKSGPGLELSGVREGGCVEGGFGPSACSRLPPSTNSCTWPRPDMRKSKSACDCDEAAGHATPSESTR
mmetsp:Transcript_14503/g.42893  ORF Transcript_14503/g.42893 Transcript_14503/m.42893 type:complete len:213 (+) Transcript_14503:138-776(+)